MENTLSRHARRSAANTPLAPFLPPRRPASRPRRYGKLESRDRDFMQACRRILASAPRPVTLRELAERVAREPAPSYYLSFSQVMKVMMRIPAMRALSPHARPVRRLLPPCAGGEPARRYAEIAARVKTLADGRPGITLAEAVARVLGGGASCFFLSPDSARRLYNSLCRRSRLERRAVSATIVTNPQPRMLP